MGVVFARVGREGGQEVRVLARAEVLSGDVIQETAEGIPQTQEVPKNPIKNTM